MARVLVTGGAGYVGGWLTDRAIEAGHDVRVYDLLLYEDRYLKEVPFIAGDILDYDRLRPHLEWADVVVWLAGLVGDPACALDPMLTSKINVESVRWLCDCSMGGSCSRQRARCTEPRMRSLTRTVPLRRCRCTRSPSSKPRRLLS